MEEDPAFTPVGATDMTLFRTDRVRGCRQVTLSAAARRSSQSAPTPFLYDSGD
jgi:hypothetical protein